MKGRGKTFNFVAASLIGVLGFVAASTASAVTLSFGQITANGSSGGAAQLGVEVTDNLAGGALFDFNVIAGTNPSINVTEIYFEDTNGLFLTPLTQSQITVQVGTSFTAGTANPGDLPGGGTGFDVTSGLLADAQGRSSNGLTIGDDLQMYLDFSGTNSYTDLLTGLSAGTFRIGMHVRSLFDANGDPDNEDASEGFINTPPGGGGVLPPVPLPAGMPLMLGALGILAAVRRKTRKSA